MRKLALILVAMIPLLVSCDKSETEPSETPTLCTVSLDYIIPSSGSMSRSGASLYEEFYNKQIATRKVTPTTYNLTFTNVADQSSATINDQWEKSHALKLLSGTYRVTGKSSSTVSDYKGGIDTLYLAFDEEITINESTSKIVLNAKYDSFMVFFDAKDITSAVYYFSDGGNYGTKHPLAKSGDIYYFFIDAVTQSTEKLLIERPTGNATINLKPMAFEKGKYYYFGDLSSEYNLPMMDSGN